MRDNAVAVAPEAVRSWLDGLARPVAMTGGTGFVGSHVVETLVAARIRPRVLVRNRSKPRWIAGLGVTWVPGSLSDMDALRTLVAGAGTVIHLAGVVRAPRASDFDRGNRAGTANLVQAVRDAAPDARLVHVSSLAAVGPCETIDGVAPEAEPHPVSAYGRSKLAAEREVWKLGAEANWIILRPPAIYGPRDTDVFQFFRLASEHVVPIPKGERWITVAYVADVVRAVLAAAAGAGGSGCTLHLGEPDPYRLPALIRLLADAGGVHTAILPVPAFILKAAGVLGSSLHRLGFHRVAMTRDKARELLAHQWTAQTRPSLEALGIREWTRFPDGARFSWQWYREHGWLR